MPEIIVTYHGEKALEALQNLTTIFDISIGSAKESPSTGDRRLPITFAQNPDVTALAGIWEGKDISLKELREKAWGDLSFVQA